ncbi:MAG TPA: DUF6448 family protein [Opitutales bacterium]|nr:DUF6448 family protein [Opitutales bacterium]
MKLLKRTLIAGAASAAVPFLTVSLHAHCDSVDGPVIQEAQAALQAGEVDSLLKWVEPEFETEIINAFERATTVAQEAPAAKDLAEQWFLETLIRRHREGEGASYTGIKPAGQIDPAIRHADHALETGALGDLAEHISHTVAQEIEKRFAEANKLRETASESPEAGREFVAAYVDYIHFIEGLQLLVQNEMHHH